MRDTGRRILENTVWSQGGGQHASEPGSSVASSSIFFQLCQATIFKSLEFKKIKKKKAWRSCAFLKLLVKTNKEMSKLRSTGLCEKNKVSEKRPITGC